MDWRDEGVLLAVRKHGETSAIIEVLTAEHGRHAGLVRGGAGRKLAPVLQPGAQLSLTWHARLETHLGAFAVEPSKSRAGLMADREKLAALGAVTAMAAFSLPEREAHPHFYTQTVGFLDRLEVGTDWPAHYVGWELALLEVLGFGLDLTACAVSGTCDDLTYVSPKSGRAVSAEAGAEWRDRLLRLPPFLCPQDDQQITATDLADGLSLTGFFLRHRLCPALNRESLPPARDRLDRVFARF